MAGRRVIWASKGSKYSRYLEVHRMTKEIETARCPDCGALLVLVGLRHLCRPVPGAHPGAGRPPIGRSAMTGAGAHASLPCQAEE
jgi:hypothetical protein